MAEVTTPQVKIDAVGAPPVDPPAARVGGANGNPEGFLISCKLYNVAGSEHGRITLVFDPKSRAILASEGKASEFAMQLSAVLTREVALYWNRITGKE